MQLLFHPSPLAAFAVAEHATREQPCFETKRPHVGSVTSLALQIEYRRGQVCK